MLVLTNNGQMGSGAPEISKLAAEQLHIDYVDRKIIAGEANNIKFSEQGVTEKEKPPGTFLAFPSGQFFLPELIR